MVWYRAGPYMAYSANPKIVGVLRRVVSTALSMSTKVYHKGPVK